MSRRGHVAGLVMVVGLVGVTLVGVFVTRLSVDLEARHAQAARTQALTLAHGACEAKQTGTVNTAQGPAQVTRQGDVVTVRLGTLEATRDCRQGLTRVAP